MGCTEPIALAYCAAKAREVLGKMPDKCLVEASGNIIKNVKNVIVPNTDGIKGIEAAAAAGIVGEEKMYRALMLANLLAIHQKTGIGRLSAYCGAVSAGCGAGCGIAYLYGADEETVAQTLVNAVAIASGMVCDGAKPSCTAKIATAVEAGILGYEMCREGQEFEEGEGIVAQDVEQSLDGFFFMKIRFCSMRFLGGQKTGFRWWHSGIWHCFVC